MQLWQYCVFNNCRYALHVPDASKTCRAYLQLLINTILPELHLVGSLYIVYSEELIQHWCQLNQWCDICLYFQNIRVKSGEPTKQVNSDFPQLFQWSVSRTEIRHISYPWLAASLFSIIFFSWSYCIWYNIHSKITNIAENIRKYRQRKVKKTALSSSVVRRPTLLLCRSGNQLS